MSTLPWWIQLWAAVYPLPQVLGGLLFIQQTPGKVILIGRILSLIIGSQVHKRRSFSKLIGPIGHAHWLLIVPYLVYVLMSHSISSELYWFITYVLVLTGISGLLDINDLLKYFRKGDSAYKR
ncbi:MAG: hypothetical protein ACI9SX_001221 [Pseudoalteromonas tetraodonis]|jgi:hypothetical protein